MSAPVVSATVQATFLSGLSNTLAQAIKAYQNDKPFELDFEPLLQFALFAAISTPPNFYWQQYLEELFPSNTVDSKGQKRLSKTNTMKKFLLDQTIGASVNTVAFLAGINALGGKDVGRIKNIVQQDFWSLMQSGWKLWPMVSVLSFTVIPANRRILFGSVVGLFWGIYLSLLTAH